MRESALCAHAGARALYSNDMLKRIFRMPLLLLALADAGSAMAQDAPQYRVVLDANAAHADVQLCLGGQHKAVAFAADSAWAKRFVDALKRSSGRSLEATTTGWRAADWQPGECLGYRADIGAIADQHEPDVGWKRGDDKVAAPQLWLLRPDVQGDADAQVGIVLPPGWNVSAPWRELGRDGQSIRFRIPNTPPDWSSAVAFGNFTEERIVLPGGMLRLAILRDGDAAEHAKLRAWLDRVAKASLSAYGRLPLAEVQVLMIPVDNDRGAVIFGQSVRGQGNALELLIDPTRPAAEFDDDWMAVHELSHLMHPYLGDRGAWLSEGLATYYQNLLRARAGLLTAVQAWDRLAAGFRRGAKSVGDETLEQVAQDMHRSHAFQRVYWAGAAYWLTVDTDLRRASHGAMTLDIALSRFRDCCLPAYRQWQPADFVARLDALTRTGVFSTRYREFAQMRAFPEWAKVYETLGIGSGAERLVFDANAGGAAIREAIMAPRPALPAAAKAEAGSP